MFVTAPVSPTAATRQRSTGLWQLAAIGLGAIIGAGIFALAGPVATHDAGPAVSLSFLLAGFASACAALSYAEFGALIPQAGSAYTYGYAVLGEVVGWFIGWFIGWDLLLEYTAIVAVVAIGVSQYISFLDLSETAAFSEAFSAVGRPEFAEVVAVGAIVGIITVLFSFTLGASRIWYSISPRRPAAPWFAATNRHHSPSRPVWIVGVIAAAIAGLVSIGTAAELTNIGILLAFVVVCAAVIVLRAS